MENTSYGICNAKRINCAKAKTANTKPGFIVSKKSFKYLKKLLVRNKKILKTTDLFQETYRLKVEQNHIKKVLVGIKKSNSH